MRLVLPYLTRSAMVLMLNISVAVHAAASAFSIPAVRHGPKQLMTIDDVAALRTISSMSVSRDGRLFAVLVRQGDPVANEYRSGWFVGRTEGGALIYIGDGGQPEPDDIGENGGMESRWSPDGRWIAYAARHGGEVQLWRARTDRAASEQITRNAADVQEFSWSDDGQALYFTTGTPRAELRAREDEKERYGYQYEEDLDTFSDLMRPNFFRSPESKSMSVWVVTRSTRHERLAEEAERLAFERVQMQEAAGVGKRTGFYDDATILPVTSSGGRQAWLTRVRSASRYVRVLASSSARTSKAIACASDECSGVIERVWWSENGQRVFFWRHEGINERMHAFYAWSPSIGSVTSLFRTRDDDLRLCSPASDDQVICVRETPTQPTHVVAIDLRSATMKVVADVNPEFQNVIVGCVERFEWDTPRFDWNEPGGQLAGLYPHRAYGFILYPPKFDPAKRYPVFIDPYVANGFTRPGSEHALHVYAANGFVVLNMEFPFSFTEEAERLGPALMKQSYSAALDYPHLSMLMESTVRGLDAAMARGFMDGDRIGIGGVSHGTFVPLYMLQKYDRIAAISISSPHWGPFQYYWPTRRGRQAVIASYGKLGYDDDWAVKPEGEGRKFWSQIDIADHVDTIEAPILMQLADQETFALLRLMRHLADENKPYDAYVFRNETHVKWQPTHLHAIMNRNLDWFRFWLQDYEHPDPSKAAQYRRWRSLRELRQANRDRQRQIGE